MSDSSGPASGQPVERVRRGALRGCARRRRVGVLDAPFGSGFAGGSGDRFVLHRPPAPVLADPDGGEAGEELETERATADAGG